MKQVNVTGFSGQVIMIIITPSGLSMVSLPEASDL
jgi:hypothetical protein